MNVMARFLKKERKDKTCDVVSHKHFTHTYLCRQFRFLFYLYLLFCTIGARCVSYFTVSVGCQ